MILQAVDTEEQEEDRDEANEEKDTIEFLSFAGGSPTMGGGKTVVLNKGGLKTKHLTCLGFCFLLAILVTLSSLALMSRMKKAVSDEKARSKLNETILAVFSFSKAGREKQALPTNRVLAWLTFALLTGQGHRHCQGQQPSNEPCQIVAKFRGNASGIFAPVSPVEGPFIPGSTIKSWRPPSLDKSQGTIYAVGHGDVARVLQQEFHLKEPVFREVERRPVNGEAFETDVLLEVRNLLADSEHPNGPRRLVIISHPHHVPYLAVLAKSARFDVAVLDPRIYEELPWEMYGCGPLGYGPFAAAEDGIAKESKALQSYGSALQITDPGALDALRPVLRAANATLDFHQCVVHKLSIGGGAAHCP